MRGGETKRIVRVIHRYECLNFQNALPVKSCKQPIRFRPIDENLYAPSSFDYYLIKTKIITMKIKNKLSW